MYGCADKKDGRGHRQSRTFQGDRGHSEQKTIDAEENSGHGHDRPILNQLFPGSFTAVGKVQTSIMPLMCPWRLPMGTMEIQETVQLQVGIILVHFGQ